MKLGSLNSRIYKSFNNYDTICKKGKLQFSSFDYWLIVEFVSKF